MKKNSILILAMLVIGIRSIMAQNCIPNPGFEEWDSIPGVRPFWNPKGYTSKNGAYQNTNRIYVFRSTDSHSGNYSLLLTPAIDSSLNTSTLNTWIVSDTLKNRAVSPETHLGSFYAPIPLPSFPKRLKGFYKYVLDSTTFSPLTTFRHPRIIFASSIHYPLNGTNFTECGAALKNFFTPSDTFISFSVDYQDECLPFTPGFFNLRILFPSPNKLQNPAGKLWLDDLEIEYETTSVEDRKKNSFVVFPNPGNQEIRIVGLSGNEKISLQNGQGKTLMEKQAEGEMEFKLETSRLPLGMYFLSVEKNGQKEVQKWVKE